MLNTCQLITFPTYSYWDTVCRVPFTAWASGEPRSGSNWDQTPPWDPPSIDIEVSLTMPGSVTIKPAPHGANEFNSKWVRAADNATTLLKSACPKEVKKLKNEHIIQTSFQNLTSETNIYPRNNGFVDAVVDAYSNHQHLELRAEDIWFSILSQLNIYINKHSEELRDMFVDHQGQKHLEILDLKDIQGDALWGIDWGKFSFKMSKMIANNIKDPSLREWILPQFTTTTKVDQAVASILMMATLQKFFTYGFGKCGSTSFLQCPKPLNT